MPLGEPEAIVDLRLRLLGFDEVKELGDKALILAARRTPDPANLFWPLVLEARRNGSLEWFAVPIEQGAQPARYFAEPL